MSIITSFAEGEERCPVCGSKDIEFDVIGEDDPSSECHCNECRYSWIDDGGPDRELFIQRRC